MFPRGRKLLLGVSGGISAYKSCDLLRRLQEQGFIIDVVPTSASLNFVGKSTWEALSGRKVLTDLWSEVEKVPHISMAKENDLIVIAPTTADLLAKLASGRADDLLTNIVLASTAPKILVPAMHTEMWLNPATVANVKTLQEFNRDKMLNSVLTPDLAAGIQEGWIQMEGISFPDGLLAASWVKEDWLDMVLQSPKEFISGIKNLAAKQIHFEGAEYLALEQPRIDKKLLKTALSVMDVCLETTGGMGVLHLNFPSAPSWFQGLNYSPLFQPEMQSNKEKALLLTRAFLDAWIEASPKRLKMHWHQIGDIDANVKPIFDYLSQNAHNWAFSRLAKSGPNYLSNKSDRNVLDKISLRLDKLAKACMRKGILHKFGGRLPSLVRLGISAGIQKRAFIRKIEIERRQNEEMKVNLGAGFLLEKARLIIAP